MDWKEIVEENELTTESSGAMFAIKSLMDKFKKTPSEKDKAKMADEIKGHETKLVNSPYWKTATIKKDYDKFKQENPTLFQV